MQTKTNLKKKLSLITTGLIAFGCNGLDVDHSDPLSIDMKIHGKQIRDGQEVNAPIAGAKISHYALTFFLKEGPNLYRTIENGENELVTDEKGSLLINTETNLDYIETQTHCEDVCIAYEEEEYETCYEEYDSEFDEYYEVCEYDYEEYCSATVEECWDENWTVNLDATDVKSINGTVNFNYKGRDNRAVGGVKLLSVDKPSNEDEKDILKLRHFFFTQIKVESTPPLLSISPREILKIKTYNQISGSKLSARTEIQRKIDQGKLSANALKVYDKAMNQVSTKWGARLLK